MLYCKRLDSVKNQSAVLLFSCAQRPYWCCPDNTPPGQRAHHFSGDKMASKGKTIICSVCGRSGKLCARDMCNTCYDRWVKSHKVRKCSVCGQMKPHHAHGMCTRCEHNWRYSINKDSVNEHKRQDRKNRPDFYKKREQRRERQPKRKAYNQARFQQYYPAHRTHLLEYQKQYKDSFPDRINHWAQKRIARIAGLPHDLTEEQWYAILEQHDYRCHYCGASGVKFHREHKIPVSRGGGYTASNIVPACPTCNMRKHTKTDTEFFDFLKKFPR